MAWLALLAAAVPAAVLAQPMVPCSWRSPNYTASYDLTALYASPDQGK